MSQYGSGFQTFWEFENHCKCLWGWENCSDAMGGGWGALQRPLCVLKSKKILQPTSWLRSWNRKWVAIISFYLLNRGGALQGGPQGSPSQKDSGKPPPALICAQQWHNHGDPVAAMPLSLIVTQAGSLPCPSLKATAVWVSCYRCKEQLGRTIFHKTIGKDQWVEGFKIPHPQGQSWSRFLLEGGGVTAVSFIILMGWQRCALMGQLLWSSV